MFILQTFRKFNFVLKRWFVLAISPDFSVLLKTAVTFLLKQDVFGFVYFFSFFFFFFLFLFFFFFKLSQRQSWSTETSVAAINKVFREQGRTRAPESKDLQWESMSGLTLGVTVSCAYNSAAPFPLLFSDPHFPAAFLLSVPPISLSLSLIHSLPHRRACGEVYDK